MMNIQNWRDDYTDIIQRLKQQRDGLRLQTHLFGMEANQHWQEAEKKWEHLQAKVQQIGSETAHSSGEIKLTFEELVDEIDAAYERLRRLL